MRFLLAFTVISGFILSGCTQLSDVSFSPSDAAFAQHSPQSSAFRPNDKEVFHHTGRLQEFTVPSGVTQVTIDAAGAQGKSTENFAPGGLGAIVSGTFSVHAGETLYVEVGLHGGGAGGSGFIPGNRGGNYSGVLHLRADGSARVLVIAGGGGGAGGGDRQGPGGHGGNGGLVGTSGGEGRGTTAQCSSCSGAGATQSAGGRGGILPQNRARDGLPGRSAFGGDGGPNAPLFGGGGGGGGWYGGGGGAGSHFSSGASGGGGGSSYVDPSASNVTFDVGYTGEGEVAISW